ncbi:MAG: NAD(P)/FAD-dependent oxidoreductase [Spirochaetia bacterium]
MRYDVCIIGAGVVGCAAARELSRYKVDVCLLEGGDDVSVGASKANSGIVHGGYTAQHGTLKGELSIAGNRRFDRLSEELGFPFRRNGSLVLAFSPEEEEALERLIENGRKNGVKGLELVDRRRLVELEPEAGPEAVSALHCRETGIVSPYEYCIALAENAAANGVTLRLNTEVTGIEKRNGYFEVEAASQGSEQTIHCSYVVNAAGVYADKIAALAGDGSISINPRRGEYLIFQRGTGSMARHVVFQAPTERGKGVLVTSTTWGNLMVGPNSEEIPDRDDTSTNEEIIRYIISMARRSIPRFDIRKIIRSFSGIRATEKRKDFIVGPSEAVEGLVHAAGIDSPGLTSSPAIAGRVSAHLEKLGLVLEEDPGFNPKREPVTAPAALRPFAEVKDKIKLPEGDPERIVCRCEQVSEKVIVDALNRGIPVRSLDGVKRRTRAGMGPCQGSFCSSRVRNLVARETGIDPQEVSGRGGGSGPLPERVDTAALRKLEI